MTTPALRFTLRVEKVIWQSFAFECVLGSAYIVALDLFSWIGLKLGFVTVTALQHKFMCRMSRRTGWYKQVWMRTSVRLLALTLTRPQTTSFIKPAFWASCSDVEAVMLRQIQAYSYYVQKDMGSSTMSHKGSTHNLFDACRTYFLWTVVWFGLMRRRRPMPTGLCRHYFEEPFQRIRRISPCEFR